MGKDERGMIAALEAPQASWDQGQGQGGEVTPQWEGDAMQRSTRNTAPIPL